MPSSMPIHPRAFQPRRILLNASALRQTTLRFTSHSHSHSHSHSSAYTPLGDADTSTGPHATSHATSHAMPDLSGAPPTLGSAKHGAGAGKLQSARGGRGRFDPASRGGRRGGGRGAGAGAGAGGAHAGDGRGGPDRSGSHVDASSASGNPSASSSPAQIPGTLATRPLSGIFAIDKPSGTSCMVLLDMLKDLFALSPLFRSADGVSLPESSSLKAWRPRGVVAPYRKAGCAPPKVGQGGTLDPLASGVLVVGVGAGTRELQAYLECSKTYAATGLLGTSTTSYDSQDPVMLRAPCAHVTPQAIEEILPYFTGPLLQFPPLYSACKMDGKRLLDYARQGLELPRPIEPREIEVVQLEMTQWLPAGTHNFTPPADEMPEEDKRMLGRVKKLAGQAEDAPDTVLPEGAAKHAGEAPPHAHAHAHAQGDDAQAEAAAAAALAPAFRLRMTVSSGTYVRSIVHDVGVAVGSAAHVQELRRTRQGVWRTGDDEPDAQRTASAGDGEGEPQASARGVEGEAEAQPAPQGTTALPWSLFAEAHAALLDEAKRAGGGYSGARRLLAREGEPEPNAGEEASASAGEGGETQGGGGDKAGDDGSASASASAPAGLKAWERALLRVLQPV